MSIENNIEAAEARRRDTHHRVWPSGKPDGPAHNGGIRAEAALPQPMTEHDSRQVLFLRREASTERHGQARDIEEICGDRLSPDAFRFTAAVYGGGEQIVVRGNAGERFGLLAYIAVERPTEVVAALAAPLGAVQRHQRRGFANGRMPQDEPADDGEDGSIGANPYCQRDHGDTGEEGRLPHGAECKVHVTHRGSEGSPGSRVADFFLHVFGITEFDPCQATGFLLGNSSLDVAVHHGLVERLNFGVEFRLDGVAVK